MPEVDGKHFPYTPEGEASAKKFAKKKGKKMKFKGKKKGFKKPEKKGAIGGMLMQRYNEGGY